MTETAKHFPRIARDIGRQLLPRPTDGRRRGRGPDGRRRGGPSTGGPPSDVARKVSQSVGWPLEALPEPFHALLAAAVRERVRVDAAARTLLDPVVADRGGGVQRLLEVARLEQVLLADSRVCPDPRGSRPELEPDRELVRVVGVLLLGEVDVRP